MDHIHVVNQVIEKSAEYTKRFHMAVIDYEKTFDSVLTAALLEDQGIEETYIRLLEDTCKEFSGREPSTSKALNFQSERE